MDAIALFADLLGALGKAHLLQREYFGQRCQQVGAVDGQLRCAVFLLGGVAHGQARGFLAAVPGAADAVGGTGSGTAHGLADAQAVQGPHRVGSEVDIRAHAQELLGLFIHHHLVASALQGDGGGQATDAGAQDSNLEGHLDFFYK
jgi:hypothetical protein